MAEPLRGFMDLRVYQLAFQLAVEILEITKRFPREELYSLTSQMRRASRSVGANIAEGYRKRQYEKMFVSKIADADGESSEMLHWIDVSRAHQYIDEPTHKSLNERYLEVDRMLGGMLAHPEKFKPRGSRE